MMWRRAKSRIIGVRDPTFQISKALHPSGSIITLGSTTGTVISLPKSEGDNYECTIIVGATLLSGSHVIKTRGGDVYRGIVLGFDTDLAAPNMIGFNAGGVGALNNTITLNRTTTGGGPAVEGGEYLRFIDLYAFFWNVSGVLASVAPATPFSQV